MGLVVGLVVGLAVGFGVTAAGDRVAVEAVGPADGIARSVGDPVAGDVAAPTAGETPGVEPRPALPPACGRSAPTTANTTNAKTRTATTSRLDGDSGFTRVQPRRGQPFGKLPERRAGPLYGTRLTSACTWVVEEAVAVRDRYNTFVARHEIAWELAMGGLALVWVALGFLVDQIGSGVRPELEAVELLLTGVFIAEFVSRLGAAHDRLQYVRGHWIDAVALVPPVRAFRLLRLLRLFRLVRAFAGFYRAAMHVQGLARHRGFAWLIVAWLSVMVTCSAFVYGAEHGTNKLMNSPFDALWWGVSTLTTVGYGDTYPITPEGRIGAMVLMLLGIGLFSAITATITSYFIAQENRTRTPGHEFVDKLGALAELREQGSLTEEEFVVAKAQVLHGGITSG